MPKYRVPLRYKALPSAAHDRSAWRVWDSYRVMLLRDDDGELYAATKTAAVRKAATLNRVEKASRR